MGTFDKYSEGQLTTLLILQGINLYHKTGNYTMVNMMTDILNILNEWHSLN